MLKLKKQLVIIALIICSFLGCNSLPDIGGTFDSDSWKQDELACSGVRNQMLDDILNAKDKLAQLGEPEIRRMFGKPDHVELFSRSQKFYLYYVAQGGQCEGEGGKVLGQMLELSLDALSRVHEINIRMDRKSIEN